MVLYNFLAGFSPKCLYHHVSNSYKIYYTIISSFTNIDKTHIVAKVWDSRITIWHR